MSNPTDPAAPQSTLTTAEARAHLLEAVSPVTGREMLPLREALGRILAADIVAPFDVPAHDNSAMDGYAVRADSLAADGESRLTVVGTAFAGNAFSGIVGAGQAVRIMTGAVLPQGADTVVVQEVTRAEGNEVVIPANQKKGANTRRAGEDLARGSVALAAGKVLGAAELGLIGSLGIAEVTVRRRLKVAFFSTGDEIASLGQTLAPGQIYDSNRYTLYGLLQRLGAEVIDLGVVRDRPEDLEAALREAAEAADVIVTSGGVSVGEADFVREILARLGEVKFWKLQIKPGRPMAFGRIGKAWLFGMPGNPVAVMVSYTQFALDALLKLAGVHPLPQRPLLKVRSSATIRKQAGRREFLRGLVAVVDGEWQVKPFPYQGSGVLRSMSEANCFIVLPEEGGDVAPGDCVDVQLFEGLL